MCWLVFGRKWRIFFSALGMAYTLKLIEGQNQSIKCCGWLRILALSRLEFSIVTIARERKFNLKCFCHAELVNGSSWSFLWNMSSWWVQKNKNWKLNFTLNFQLSAHCLTMMNDMVESFSLNHAIQFDLIFGFSEDLVLQSVSMGRLVLVAHRTSTRESRVLNYRKWKNQQTFKCFEHLTQPLKRWNENFLIENDVFPQIISPSYFFLVASKCCMWQWNSSVTRFSHCDFFPPFEREIWGKSSACWGYTYSQKFEVWAKHHHLRTPVWTFTEILN